MITRNARGAPYHDACQSRDVLRRTRADDVVAIWESLFLSRSSRFIYRRHCAINQEFYERALQAAQDSGASDTLLQARLLRLLGRNQEAAASFDLATETAPDCAEAWAWRWELEFSATDKKRSFEGIDRARALEPRHALWAALRGIGQSIDILSGRRGETVGDRRSAYRDLEEALSLERDCTLALVAVGLLDLKTSRIREALSSFQRAAALAPNASFILNRTAECHLALGEREEFVAAAENAMLIDEDLGYFQQALNVEVPKQTLPSLLQYTNRHLLRHPKDYWMYVLRGDLKRAPLINDPLGGLQDLEKAVELNPECSYAWAYLARARQTHAGIMAAIAAADRAIALSPRCGWHRIWRGEIRRRLGDLSGALSDIGEGLALDRDYELGYSWRGGVLRSLGRASEAVDDLRLSERLNPTHAWTVQEKALTLRALGHTQEALAAHDHARRLDSKFVWCANPAKGSEAISELDHVISRDDRNASAWAWRAHTNLLLRNHDDALSDATRALDIDNKSTLALTVRGRARRELGRRRAALADFQRALKIDPRDSVVRSWSGKLLFELGKPRAALKELRRAADSDRKTASIYLWQGEAAEALGLWNEAENSYAQALSIDRRYLDALLSTVRLRVRRSDGPGAIRTLLQAARLAPRHPKVRIACGLVLDLNGFPADARRQYRMAFSEGVRLSVEERTLLRGKLDRHLPASRLVVLRLLTLAAHASRSARHEEALALAGDALRVDPMNVDALQRRVEANRCLNRFGPMLRDLNRLVALNSRDPLSLLLRSRGRRNASQFSGALRDARLALAVMSANSPEAWVACAEALRNLGREMESVNAASGAIRLRPNWSWAYVVRGKAFRQSGRIALARADFEAAIRLDPEDAKARGWLAETLRKDGRIDAAARMVRAAEKRMPDCAWIVALESEIDRERGRYYSALRRIRHAVRLDPHACCAHDFLGDDPPHAKHDAAFAWIYALRGETHRQEKRWDRAQSDLEWALHLDPGCFWARAWLGELLLARGNSKQAARELRRALRLVPSFADGWVWLGRALLEGNYRKPALAAFERASHVEPKNPWALIGRGTAAQSLGQARQSERLFRRAQTLAPTLFASARSNT